MRRITMFLAIVVLTLAAGWSAAQITAAPRVTVVPPQATKPIIFIGPPVRAMGAVEKGCCFPALPGAEPYPAAPEILGDANHGCYQGDSWSPAACNAPVPTVAPEPTTAPPPVPTVAPPFEPKDIEVPGFFSFIVGLLSPKNPLPVGWGIVAAGILTGLVAALRQLLALFGAKLGTRGIIIATTVLGSLAAIAAVVSDGVIAGGDEWSILLIAVVSIPSAFLGYRILYSEAAKVRINNA